jgi:hypothetical protein
MRKRWQILTTSLVCCLFSAVQSFAAEAPAWQAGVARVNITPAKLMWLSGYGARDRPAEGKLADLYAKALALTDPNGKRAVVITCDLVGVDRQISGRVTKAICEANKLERSAVALCTSHTHTGPVVGDNLRLMYFFDDAQQKLVDEYAAVLEKKLIAVAADALAHQQPAELRWSIGQCGFAVNRRNNAEAKAPELQAAGKLVGPVDHDLPLLAVYTGAAHASAAKPADAGQLAAVLFGYACHATVLASYEWSGDWPGFAQSEIERRHPGATALYFAGCGGDQNPLPRRQVELAKKYGAMAADSVDAALKSGTQAVGCGVVCSYREIDLPLARVPGRKEIEQAAQSKNRIEAACAKRLLAQLDRGEKVAATYPYPIQTWRFTSTTAPVPTIVFLGGEVVVDYALLIKSDAGKDRSIFVAAYANDVMAYIPSRRILAEGGYEGLGAQAEYGFLSPWSPEVETLIHKEVARQIKP